MIGYLLTDQAYAVSIVRWTKEADDEAAGGPPAPGLDHKLPFYFGAALMLWGNWQVCTIVGVFVGSALPDSLPLDFAVPLVFLVLLVPAITSRPSAVAAIVGWWRGAARRPRPAPATSACCSARWPASSPGAVAEVVPRAASPRSTTPRSPPTPGWRRE